MPTRMFNPAGVHPPGGRYSHGAEITLPARRLLISGQIGMAPDGSVPADPRAQIAQALANLAAVLAGGGMGVGDVVKMTVFLTDPALIPLWREVREGFLGGHAPASTLLVVAGLAAPHFVVEVEAEAAG